MGRDLLRPTMRFLACLLLSTLDCPSCQLAQTHDANIVDPSVQRWSAVQKASSSSDIQHASASPVSALMLLLFAGAPAPFHPASQRKISGKLDVKRRYRAYPPAMVGALDLLDECVRTLPYLASFCITGFKASMADILAQSRESAIASRNFDPREECETQTNPSSSQVIKQVPIISCDEISCEVVEKTVVLDCTEAMDEVVARPAVTVDVKKGFDSRRTLAFLLYGGLYQGCFQYFMFNQCYPGWFGIGKDWETVLIKVVFDQLVLTPFLCLPVAYLVKAIVLGNSPLGGLKRYVADAKRDLLLKYWGLWTPVQFVTFGLVPDQWRITFIAFVSFIWTSILSSITSRNDAQDTISDEKNISA